MRGDCVICIEIYVFEVTLPSTHRPCNLPQGEGHAVFIDEQVSTRSDFDLVGEQLSYDEKLFVARKYGDLLDSLDTHLPTFTLLFRFFFSNYNYYI